jgi:4-aminobutyrate aminotransferase-like enzyme
MISVILAVIGQGKIFVKTTLFQVRIYRTNMRVFFMLIADALLHDPQFQQAKESILAILDRYRQTITEVRPAQSDLRVGYAEAVKQLEVWRGQGLFYPYLGSGIGNGALVELADGSVKYDFISGIGTHWGHCHPRLAACCIDASVQDICTQGNLQNNRDASTLINLLIKHSGMDHCLLSTSGAMANENALKIIFQKKAPAYRLLAFEKCFMGRTLALAQITDKAALRDGLPPTLHVDYIPFYDWRDPKGSTQRAVFTLKKLLQRYPQTYACMCFELILGEAGAYPGSREFFIELLKILKEQQIAVFVDEVQSFGRTDRLFAFQHYGLEPYVDVVSCGKMLQACATLFRDDFKPRPGLISQTFTSATASIHAGTAILTSLIEEGFLGVQGKNMALRKTFVDHLQRLAHIYPEKLEGPFGHGLMIACTPFRGEKGKVHAFAQALFNAGVISFIAEAEPMRLRFLVPAGGVNFADIDRAAEIFEIVLKGDL